MDLSVISCIKANFRQKVVESAELVRDVSKICKSITILDARTLGIKFSHWSFENVDISIVDSSVEANPTVQINKSIETGVNNTALQR